MVSPTTQSISETAQLKIIPLIAKELGVGTSGSAAVALLDEGATVPFIARYRKEATGNLDDTHLRTLEERLLYLRELEERRAAILASIEEQGKLTDALRGEHRGGDDQARRGRSVSALQAEAPHTRADCPRSRVGAVGRCAAWPIRCWIPSRKPLKYVSVVPAAEGVEAINVPDAKTALEGARDILVERFAETAELLAELADAAVGPGRRDVTVMKDKETAEEEKFRDYYAYSETIRTIPSHRALALFRGRTLGVLKIELGLGEALEAVVPHPCVSMIAAHVGIEDRGRPRTSG